MRKRVVWHKVARFLSGAAAATMLEVSEAGSFEIVEHHLPANAPSAESGCFPIVFFET